VMLEFVRDGQPVPDGEEGEIVATALDGHAQPLLRWRTGDVGCRIPEPECACGRTTERILVTDGRIGTLVTSPGGTRIHGDWFDWLFGSVPGIASGRAVQDRAGALVLEIVAPGAADEAQAAALRDALRQVDPAFSVEVRRVAQIPESPDGRRRTVVSAAPLTWHAPEPEPVLAGRRG
jgi:phenylacetate-CoA ligase